MLRKDNSNVSTVPHYLADETKQHATRKLTRYKYALMQAYDTVRSTTAVTASSHYKGIVGDYTDAEKVAIFAAIINDMLVKAYGYFTWGDLPETISYEALLSRLLKADDPDHYHFDGISGGIYKSHSSKDVKDKDKVIRVFKSIYINMYNASTKGTTLPAINSQTPDEKMPALNVRFFTQKAESDADLETFKANLTTVFNSIINLRAFWHQLTGRHDAIGGSAAAGYSTIMPVATSLANGHGQQPKKGKCPP